MTTDGKRMPKYARVAAAVKGQITDGTLRPGQPAPSGAALSRVTGYSTLTCRRALRVLIADGVLLPGPSSNARPRVAGPPQQPGERDLAAAARALSAGLAARRRAKGLTQPELARLLDVSVTTVGHAETGRLWQSRNFWSRADVALGADGDLLRLHEAFGAASAASGEDPPGPGRPPAATAAAGQAAQPAAAVGPGPAADQGAEPGEDDVTAGPCTFLAVGGRDGSPAAPEPACVMIMWGNGAVTTVHRPEAVKQ